VLHLSGRVLGEGGTPLPDALVEIWQCDAKRTIIMWATAPPDGR
jgi:hypothetical protein